MRAFISSNDSQNLPQKRIYVTYYKRILRYQYKSNQDQVYSFVQELM